MAESLNRHKERGRTDRAELNALLDQVPWGTLVAVRDGRPFVVPMLFARDGDRLLFHGSTGAGLLRYVALGGPVAFSVTSIDGIVVAHTTFSSSANYRSVVIHGQVEVLADGDRWDALDLLSNRMLPGRTDEVRPMNNKEIAATTVLSLPIGENWTMKARSGFKAPDTEPFEAWTGVVEMRTAYGPAIPDEDGVGRELPASVRSLLD